ncbi:hypothetical protein EMIT093MI4_80104 [Pseudomonas sp. IT-93MI4]
MLMQYMSHRKNLWERACSRRRPSEQQIIQTFLPGLQHHPTLKSTILGFSFLSSATTPQRLQP